MPTPHVHDVGIIAPFLAINLRYRSTSETGAVSEVERLEAVEAEQLPVRFSKVIEGLHSKLITYEDRFLTQIEQNAPDAKTVKRLDYSHGISARGSKIKRYTIITEDAGVDVDKWYRAPVQLTKNNQVYVTIFCHPAMLLRFVRGVIVALESIHKHGIVHCDIKEDQICIPFVRSTVNGELVVTPNFDEIRLIDFGLALWEQVPLASSETLPLLIDHPAPYQASNLINALRWQAQHKKDKGFYSFEALVKDVDYGTDLYSLGFFLNTMLKQLIERNISLSDATTWSLFIDEYKKWVEELLEFKFGRFPPYYKRSPHAEYLEKIDVWIKRVDRELGYKTENLSFIIKPKHTTTANELPDAESTPLVPEPKPNKLKVVAWILLSVVVLVYCTIQYNATAMYYLGLALPYSEAVYWHRKAADKGNAKAMFKLGLAYGYGYGVPENDSEAVYWYRKAADKGNVKAMSKLGFTYYYAIGVPKSYSDSVYWFRKAADKGDGVAMYFVGLAYLSGEGVPKSYSNAMGWWRKAANKDNTDAMHSLGWVYETGIGVPENKSEALNWYKKAKQAGAKSADAAIQRLQNE